MKIPAFSLLSIAALLVAAAPAAAIVDSIRDTPIVGEHVGTVCDIEDIVCDAIDANNPVCDGCIRGSTPVGDNVVCIITPHAAGRITYCSIVAVNGSCAIDRPHERVVTLCIP